MPKSSSEERIVRIRGEDLPPRTEEDDRRLDEAMHRPIDTSDIPEQTAEDMQVKRVRRDKDLNIIRLEEVTLRLDKDLVEWFKQQGEGERLFKWRMRDVLLRYMEAEREKR